MQSNVPPCKVYYIDVTNLKILQLSYMALTIHTAFKPGKCQHQPGLSLFTSKPHSSGFSRFCHSMRTKSCRLSATESFLAHYPLFIICATRRRFRSISTFRASRSPSRLRKRSLRSSSSVRGLGKLPVDSCREHSSVLSISHVVQSITSPLHTVFAIARPFSICLPF